MASNQKRRITRLATPIVLTGMMMVGGCVSVLPEPATPNALIRLTADDVRPAQQALETVVVVHSPVVPGALSGVEMASSEGRELRYINDVRWADTPNRMIQSAMIDALSRTDGEGFAVGMKAGARANYALRSTVRDLSVDKDTGLAVCDLRLTLVAQPGRRIVTTGEVRVEIASSGRSDTARANALAQAMAEASAKAADFVAQKAIKPESD